MASAAELAILLKVKDEASGKLDAVGKSGMNLGDKLKLGALGAGIAVAGIGAASITMAADFEASMANVATLLGRDGSERVKELEGDVKRLSQSTGKSLDDLSGGLYQVVSAFGAGGDSAKILELAAKASSAGLATTEDSVNLLSAVTKGYGDTSTEAVAKVSDLAFQTVKLGQTTFPELAGSMGKVVPLAAALGVKTEELFGSMATLTGVTGNTAEVSTQLRATIQALLKPSESMAGAIGEIAGELEAQGKIAGPTVDAYNREKAALFALQAQFASGKGDAKALEKAMTDQRKVVDEAAAALAPAIVQGVGFGETLKMLSKEASGNNSVLGDMFGSVESLNAVLALGGPQAEDYAAKTKAMGEAGGATTEAFEIQQKTFKAQLAKLKSTFSVVMVEIGQKILPILTGALEKLGPWIQKHLPGALATMRAAFDKVGKFITEKVVPVFDWLAERIGAVVGIVKDVAGFLSDHAEVLAGIAAVILAVMVPAIAAWTLAEWAKVAALAAAALAFVAANAPLIAIALAIGGLVVGILWAIKHWDLIKKKTLEVVGAIRDFIVEKFDTIRDKIMGAIGAVRDFIVEKFDMIRGKMIGVVEAIKDTFIVFKDWFLDHWKGIVTGVLAVVFPPGAGLFYIITHFQTIKDRALEIWDSFKAGFLGIWSGIVDGVKGFINVLIGAINWLIQGLNKIHFEVPDWIPKYGGKGWGISLPEIPMLAQGAIVTRPTLAMIGERGPEAVVPLSGRGMGGNAINVTVNVQGSVIAERDLASNIRRELLKLGTRNVSVGLA